MRLTRSFLQKLPAESYVRSMNFSEARITECDVFISHSYENKKVVGRLYSLFQHCGYRPFVDWIDTDLTDRSQMNASGARLLRKVLARSKCLVYVDTIQAECSVWCPWELGLSDAFTNGRCAIMAPLDDYLQGYDGNEYLGIYPTIEFDGTHDFYVTLPNKVQMSLRKFIDSSLSPSSRRILG